MSERYHRRYQSAQAIVSIKGMKILLIDRAVVKIMGVFPSPSYFQKSNNLGVWKTPKSNILFKTTLDSEEILLTGRSYSLYNTMTGFPERTYG